TGLCPAGVTVGGFTATAVGNTTNYAWSCNGSSIGGLCVASYTTGGGGFSCTPGTTVGVQTTPITATTTGLCPAGVTVGGFTATAVGNTTNYAWSCNGSSIGGLCVASYTSGGGDIPTTSGNITVPGSQSYCGNGVVERPNAIGQYESCDLGGQNSSSWCDSTCQITITNPGSNLPGNLTITTPGSYSMNISTYKLIVGNEVSVFSNNDAVAFETNNPMYLNSIPATITNNSPLLSGANASKTINNIGVGGPIRFEIGRDYDGSGNLVNISYEERIYPNTTILFQGSELQGFKGDISSITSGSYKDTITTNPTYRSQGIYASLQYLESPFNIRVSKPIISNTAGGNAFIGSPLGYNVNTVVNNFLNELKKGNFITSTVNTSSSYALSSATTSVSDAGLSQTISTGTAGEEVNITDQLIATSDIYTPSVNITSENDIITKSIKLGDTESIRVFKSGNVSIDRNLNLSTVKTVIIEDGDLVINKNIRYNNNISSYAWIVKNGNIRIDPTVTNIAGVYVVLNGSILSNGGSTSNRLTVDGSLYGNTLDLVNNRSYVRGQTGYSALNVGVVINYSNRVIMYPPPFLAKFLEQYSLQRVAR
ncbi:MAG: hypothetical protein PHQ95_04205, partial [Candidatus Gracilibacteria bacterium]|nr:hypothetical protein [Candidatus Gracilibacteria bacterium]